MAYTLLVQPIVLAALALVIWALWRAVDHFDPAAARRHRSAVVAGAGAIGLLLLGPPVWAVISQRPGAVLGWTGGLGAAGVVVWGYARLIGALHRRAGRRDGGR